jgi:hypothetical protein
MMAIESLEKMPIANSSDLSCVIVFTHGPGRFANQLTVLGHLIGLAAEHPGLRVVDFAFWPYADLCAGTVNNLRCEYPPRPGSSPGLGVRMLATLRRLVPQRRERAVHRWGAVAMHKLMPRQSINYALSAHDVKLGATEFLGILGGRRKVLLSGWNLRDWDLFEKHQGAIRQFLSPAERFRRPAKAFIDDLRQRHDTLVGVLIRQDDYRIWNGGKFFFTSENYRIFIAQLRERFGPRAGIVVACDELQPDGIFDDLGVTFATGAKGQPGHYLESFSELSMCDVVVSAPSTFAAWAAFLGERPILPISTAVDDLRHVPTLPRHLLDARSHPAFLQSVA